MKTLNVIFIATALLLATACTDTEKVLPFDATSTLGFDQKNHPGDVATPRSNLSPLNINVGKAPNEKASYDDKTTQNTEDPTRQSDTKYFGELLPESFLDCGTFIRLTDDQLFEVFNPDFIPDHNYRKTGGPVAFSFITSEDMVGTCGLGIAVELVTISFLPAGKTGSDKANTKGSGKN